jgi:O-succinylbenzoate synthase
MQIRSLILREIRMRLLAPFETSFGRSDIRRILLVAAEVDGVHGWGEVTAGSNPFYSPETVDTAWHVLRDFIWPLLKGKQFRSAEEITTLLEPVRGHNMAKAGVETAVWDAQARLANIPLWKLLGGVREEIACGVSIGIQPSCEHLLACVEKELAAGYQRIKVKIKPGWDLEPVRQLRRRFPDIRLMVDANSAYRLEDAAHLKAFDDYHLMMIEQPLAWDDIHDHSLLQKQLQTPICLDESIHSATHARAAIALGACRIINIKLGRVGGHAAAREMQAYCADKGVPVWCGGMLESGIGRAHNIAMSTLPNFTLPGDVSASRRYWAEDIIEPAVEVTPQGTIRVRNEPGIGYQPRTDLIERLTTRQEVLS